jgi:hypothetical protein
VKLTKRAEAMQCLGALQEAACSSCREMLTWVTAAYVDVAALNKLNACLHVPDAVLQERSNCKREAHRRRITAIKTRLHVRPRPSMSLGACCPDGVFMDTPACCMS